MEEKKDIKIAELADDQADKASGGVGIGGDYSLYKKCATKGCTGRLAADSVEIYCDKCRREGKGTSDM